MNVNDWPEFQAFIVRLGNEIYENSSNRWHTFSLAIRAKQGDYVTVTDVELREVET